MKFSLITVAATFAALAMAQAYAAEDNSVLQFQSTASRVEVRAGAVDAAHAANPYAEAASSAPAAAQASPRDRAAVQTEARVSAHASSQGVRGEIVAGGVSSL